MSAVRNVVSFNGPPTVVEHLIAAYEVTHDPVSKALIKAALVHEGYKLAATVPLEQYVGSARTD